MGLMDKVKRPPPSPSPAPIPGGELVGTFTGTFTGTFVPSSGPAPTPPSPSPGPSPAPSPGESADGATIPPAAMIVDSLGGQWTVTAGVVHFDGAVTPSANVVLLLYFSKEIYQQNEAGGWWKWTNGNWSDSQDPRVPAPSPSPPPSGGGDVELILSKNTMLQIDTTGHSFWIQDDTWGTQGMTRGTYTGVNGTTFESYFGRAADGSVRYRWAWKVPKGPNEVKLYETCIFGAKPGYYNEWTTPNGLEIVLPNGKTSTVAPSGVTPGTWLPLVCDGNLAPIMATCNFRHMEEPTGLGQLAYDIWMQSTPEQAYGFGNAPLTHEIMIQLDNWGSYGGHPHGSNPAWYNQDVTLEGILWHFYYVENFGHGWKFCVFKPDTPLMPVTKELNLAAFANWLKTKGFANGREYMVDIEIGVEAVEATGDIQVDNYVLRR